MSRGPKLLSAPLPVARAIQWLPIGDRHYVIASLQPGGSLPLYITQALLTRLAATGSKLGDGSAIGLVVGSIYRCPNTGNAYIIADELDNNSYFVDVNEAPGPVLRKALDKFHGSASRLAVGCYYVSKFAPDVAARQLMAPHASPFPDETSVLLTLTPRSSEVQGVVFRYARDEQRPYRLPFLELVDAKDLVDQPAKPTVVAWPDYLATEPTTRKASAPGKSNLPHLVGAAEQPSAKSRTTDVRQRRDFPVTSQTSVADEAISIAMADERRLHRAVGDQNTAPAPATNSAPASLTSADIEERATIKFLRPRGPTVERAGAETATPVSLPVPTRSHPAGTLTPSPAPRARTDAHAHPDVPADSSPPDDAARSKQPAPSHKPVRQIDSAPIAHDTAAGDRLEHYVGLATRDGFFVVETFDGSVNDEAHTTAVLHDPYCGLLLVVFAAHGLVVDAALHYNIHVDDPAMLQTAFSRHCDRESQTLYVRESTTDGLLERARRLRATGALVPEWNVAPSIHLVGPSEWEAIAGRDPLGTVQQIHAVNQRRLAELPETILSRYRLTTH